MLGFLAKPLNVCEYNLVLVELAKLDGVPYHPLQNHFLLASVDDLPRTVSDIRWTWAVKWSQACLPKHHLGHLQQRILQDKDSGDRR